VALNLEIIGELFEKYLRQVYFAYGQAFFITGFAIALLTRSKSSLKIARRLWLLAGYGFTRALAEWGSPEFRNHDLNGSTVQG
jgi:hypothetical protein